MNRKTYLIFFSLLICIFIFSFNSSVYAVCPGDPGCPQTGDAGNNQGMPQTGDPGNPDNSSNSNSNSNAVNQSPQSVQDISLQFHLENPLGNNGPSNLEGFIAKILDVIILIAIPIVTFFIIYSGLLFVMAAGNSEKLSKAKTTLMYTLIGAALLLGAKVLALAIESTLKDITTTFIITNLFG